MKTFKIIDYIDICSYSLLKTLDSTICNTYIHSSKILLNINDPKIKKLIKYYLFEYLNNQKVFGVKLLILNSCDTSDNWRNSDKPKIDFSKYKLCDSSVQLSDFLLKDFLNKLWNLLLKNKDYFYITHINLDILDLTTLINSIISKDFIIQHNNSNIILKDGNLKFSKNDKIPDYYYEDIRQQLELKKII